MVLAGARLDPALMISKFKGFGGSKREQVLRISTKLPLFRTIWLDRNCRVFEERNQDLRILWDHLNFQAFPIGMHFNKVYGYYKFSFSWIEEISCRVLVELFLVQLRISYPLKDFKCSLSLFYQILIPQIKNNNNNNYGTKHCCYIWW